MSDRPTEAQTCGVVFVDDEYHVKCKKPAGHTDAHGWVWPPRQEPLVPKPTTGETATSAQMACAHQEFYARVAVNRIEDKGAFMADVSIACRQCGLPFHFLGVPLGLSFGRPMASIDQTELRVPIAPGAVRPEASGVARFEV